MIYRSLQNTKVRGFSLIEATTALMILAFISASVLVVINRCVVSAADSAMRMQAFEVARENMEKLLTADAVEPNTEFGTSDNYPEIQWQTVVEPFYEPITKRIWARGVCSAEYTDSAGEKQTVELTHWLTDLSKQQVLDLIKQRQKESEQLAAISIDTIEKAAGYAGVDVPTIQQWINKGMPTFPDGSFAKPYIDLFTKNNGNPSPEDIASLPPPEKLITLLPKQSEPTKPETPESGTPSETKTPSETGTSPETKTPSETGTSPDSGRTIYTEENLRKWGIPDSLIPSILQLLNSE